MFFAFLFCCMNEGLKPLWGWPSPTATKGLNGHSPLHYLCEWFYPTMSAPHARQRGQFALWNCGRGNSFGSHGHQRGQAEGRVRLFLGTWGMQMAAVLSGHCVGARLSAGVLHVLGVPGNHRSTSTSAVSSREMGSSYRHHICFFCLGGGGGESKVEIITGKLFS